MKSTVFLLFLAFPAIASAQIVGPPIPPPSGVIPPPDGTLKQTDSQGTAIPLGGVTTEGTIFFECVAPVDEVKLNIEIQLTSEGFTDSVTVSSIVVAENQTASVSFDIPDMHPYRAHWQAWWEEVPGGQVSPKVSFGNNQEIDPDFHKGDIGPDGLIYRETFLSAGYPPGWSFVQMSPSSRWFSDGDPANAPGGATKSSPYSLNYNNGTDYEEGYIHWGFATSPIIDLGLVQNPVLTFWCNYQTDTTGTLTDQRWIAVHNEEASTFWLDTQLSTDLGTCAQMGSWHKHTIPLNGIGNGNEEVVLRFTFDTINALDNNHAGWFVDDIEIQDALSPGLDSASLDQLDFQGNSIPVGDVVDGGLITFVGGVEVPNGKPVRLEIEFQRPGITFTGIPHYYGDYMPETGDITVTVKDISSGDHRWQARLADPDEMHSEWIEFGLNPPTDRDFHWVSIQAYPGDGNNVNPALSCWGSTAMVIPGIEFFLLIWGFALLLAMRIRQT